eukprot:777884-Pyramimonas_sp.AAC.1
MRSGTSSRATARRPRKGVAPEREQHQWHPQAGQDQGQREREGRGGSRLLALNAPLGPVL